jgi:hypothetical protein
MICRLSTDVYIGMSWVGYHGGNRVSPLYTGEPVIGRVGSEPIRVTPYKDPIFAVVA